MPLGSGFLAENSRDNGDEGHGSIGLLSSRRSNNGAGQGENVHMAQSLLQYMEKRLASHNEQKQTSLSDLKARPGLQSEEEDGLKQQLDHVEVNIPPIELAEEEANLTRSQQMVSLSGLQDWTVAGSLR